MEYLDISKPRNPNQRGSGCEAMSQCNGRGACINGACNCDSGFDYFDCSVQVTTCPNNCRNRGQCIDGKCHCEAKYTGEDCSEIKCQDNCSNNGNCIVIFYSLRMVYVNVSHIFQGMSLLNKI